MDNDSEIEELRVGRLIDQLEDILNRQAKASSGTTATFRPLDEGFYINDTLDSRDEDSNDIALAWQPTEGIRQFETSRVVPVAAIDSGIVRLVDAEDGPVIALRGSAVIDDIADRTSLGYAKTGVMYLRSDAKMQLLYMIGQDLGKPDLFVELADDRPVSVKRGVADNDNQFTDRFRNWFERLIQERAVTMIKKGILLLDGALTMNTRDTPTEFFRNLVEVAEANDNSVIALSKQSELLIGNPPRAIKYWLDDQPGMSCYRLLSKEMRSESQSKANRVLGNTYAARFSPTGACYRMDVYPAQGQSDDEAISLFYTSCLFPIGYPDILVRAHTYSYFTSPDVIQLQAQARATYGLIPRQEADLGSIFSPFGGRYKK